MLELAVLLRALQLYSHHAHHVAARIVFNQDHEFLGEIYLKAEDDYDDVIERFIGLFGDEALNEMTVLTQSAAKINLLPIKGVKENKVFLQTVLDLLKEINAKIEVISKDPKTTQGTIQLIGDIANKHEVLIYKIKQRIK